MLEEKDVKITFRQKRATSCPICRFEFHREELFTGRGRLIAGDLDEELRRSFQENKKYGKIIPLIYPLNICPNCLFAAYPEDFSAPMKEVKEKISQNAQERKKRIEFLFPGIDFTEDRRLEHGLAGYLLAVSCYSFFEKKYAPSFKRAMSSIRVAWLARDYAKENNDPKFEHIHDIFNKKAADFYSKAVEMSQTGGEISDGIKHYGPDIDKNFGHDGMLYMASLLNYKQADLEIDPETQAEVFIKSKRIVSKLFGMGKASKEKPGAILDLARDLYKNINERVKVLEEQLGRKLD